MAKLKFKKLKIPRQQNLGAKVQAQGKGFYKKLLKARKRVV